MYFQLIFSIFLSLICAVPLVSFADDSCDYDKIRRSSFYMKNEDLLAQAVERNCTELMDMALKKEKDEDIFRATRGFMINVVDHFSIFLQGMKHVDEDDPVAKILKDKFQVLGKFNDFMKIKCPDESKSTDACKALNTYVEYVKKIQEKFNQLLAEEEAENKDAEYKNDLPGLNRSRFCDKIWAKKGPNHGTKEIRT